MLGEGEEREAYHWHECPGCGVEWEHGSRRCVSGRELRCEGCEGEEENAPNEQLRREGR